MDNRKYNYFAIVVNPKKESANPTEELAHYQDLLLAKYKSFLATIIHDKDNLENGEIKTTHAHIFIDTPSKMTCKQVLTSINEILNINLNQIQVEGTNNHYLQVQYLIHKNDPNKFQYFEYDVRTNNPDLLDQRLNITYKSQDQLKQELFSDLKNCSTLLEFAEKHGIEDTNKYRNLFKDFKQEQRYDIKHLNEELNQRDLFMEKLKELLKNQTRYDGFIEAKYIENLIHSFNI